MTESPTVDPRNDVWCHVILALHTVDTGRLSHHGWFAWMISRNPRKLTSDGMVWYHAYQYDPNKEFFLALDRYVMLGKFLDGKY